MKTPKQEAMELLERLPDDASIDTVINELHVKSRLLRALAHSEQGEGIPHEEVELRLNKWLESSGLQRLSKT